MPGIAPPAAVPAGTSTNRRRERSIARGKSAGCPSLLAVRLRRARETSTSPPPARRSEQEALVVSERRRPFVAEHGAISGTDRRRRIPGPPEQNSAPWRRERHRGSSAPGERSQRARGQRRAGGKPAT